MTAADVIGAARASGAKLAVGESCTGGLLAAALTAVPGASHVVDRGYVTYSNAAKQQMLGVLAETLEAFGAVSEEVAREMAEGARHRAQATLAVAITGIAGPGGSEHKPEGRVCFALATPDGTRTETIEFGALGRDRVRQRSVDYALDLFAGALPPPPGP